MDKKYARRKHGEEAPQEMIRGAWEATKETLGTLCYQEQLMQLTKIIAGFNDNQADSIARKAVAKKRKDMMELFRRSLIWGKINEAEPEGAPADGPYYDAKGKYGGPIPGGLSRGYSLEELSQFFHDLEGYASYLFNKSHSACYAYIGVVTAWLKTYYPVEFMAALLSSEKEDDDIEKYIDVAEAMGIKVEPPDINESLATFLPKPKTGAILYGLKAVKSLGEKALPVILEMRPFASLEDAVSRMPKRAFDKKVGENLIKAGAFRFENENRMSLLNQFHRLRGDKKEEILDESRWQEAMCLEYEKEAMGTAVTVKPWWKTVKPGEKVEATMTLERRLERNDKNKKLMATIEGVVNGCYIRAICFASIYCRCSGMLDPRVCKTATLIGYKDEKGTLVIRDVKGAPKTQYSQKFLARKMIV